jgi:hypothetical protein
MTAGQGADDHADPRSLTHALLGQLHGLMSDALVTNRAVLFRQTDPEQLQRIYRALSSTIGQAQATVDRLDHELLRNAGVPAEMLELMLQRWSQDRYAYESQPTRQPDALARSLHTADTLLLHDLTAVVPALREVRGWLRLVLSELETPGTGTGTGTGAPRLPASLPGAAAPADADAGPPTDGGWRVDARTDEPALGQGASRR